MLVIREAMNRLILPKIHTSIHSESTFRRVLFLCSKKPVPTKVILMAAGTERSV